MSLSLLYLAWLVLAAPLAAQTQNSNNPTGGGRSGGTRSHSIRGKIFMPSGNLSGQRIRIIQKITTQQAASAAKPQQ